MNRERIKQLLPIMQAFAEGKQIQFKYSVDGSWADVADTNFTAAPEKYRIKPEVKKVESWVHVSKARNVIIAPIFAKEEDAIEHLMFYGNPEEVAVVKIEGSYEV